MTKDDDSESGRVADARQLAYTHRLVTIVGLLTGLLVVVLIRRYIIGH
jgi:hypothetical protein